MAAVIPHSHHPATTRGLWRKSWVRFGLAVGAYGLALAFLYSSPRLIQVLEPLDRLTAAATATVLSWLGTEVHHVGSVLTHPGGFSYEIYYRCTGLIVAALLVVGVFALPGLRRHKLSGALLGALLVLLLNLARLVSLFLLGVWFPAAFGFVHAVVWEAAMLGFVLGYWLLWLKRPPRAQSSGDFRPWTDRSVRALY